MWFIGESPRRRPALFFPNPFGTRAVSSPAALRPPCDAPASLRATRLTGKKTAHAKGSI